MESRRSFSSGEKIERSEYKTPQVEERLRSFTFQALTRAPIDYCILDCSNNGRFKDLGQPLRTEHQEVDLIAGQLKCLDRLSSGTSSSDIAMHQRVNFIG